MDFVSLPVTTPFPEFPHPIGVAGIAGKPGSPETSRNGNRGKGNLPSFIGAHHG